MVQYLTGFRTITLLLLSFTSLVLANRETIDENKYEICAGMYSKEDWGGKVDPFISFNLKEINDGGDVIVAIYDFQDFEHLGVDLSDGEHYYLCDDYAIRLGLCTEDHEGEFIITDTVYDPYSGSNRTLVNPIMTFSQNELGLHDTKYPISNTGYYCVSAFQSDSNVKFKATINFRNAYGHLAGSEVNNLPLYGLLAICYVVAMALYSFAFWKHKHELLPLQKYLLAFYMFLTIETIFVWAYYDLKNEKGNTAGIKVYSVFLSILSAGKVTFSFFLLLIIGLGYGIVYPKLNKTLMRRCQFYTAFSFCLCCAFLIQSYFQDPENPSALVFISFAPTAVSMFIFYFMIIRSMTKTLGYLKEQRQVVKLNMYKRLLIIIYISLAIMLIGFVISSIIFATMNTLDMIEQYWRSRFFFTNFWPTLVYFAVFVIISFIWRPTDTSYMLAVSQQLPTDPENVADFDLSDLQSLGDNLDDEFDADNDRDNLSIITDDDVASTQGHHANDDDQLPQLSQSNKEPNHLDLTISEENLEDDEHDDDPANKRTIL
ncbi:Ptm1p KABA2_09S04158 [Maudiozyma barnettii]|uniref:Membrane protein PTM1 n=1 Tax=Maudiozyma barnettii TaxID=61262 RepID=A0A8H2VIY4_9SACH|nr:uncharacterized protein KABA2_09S04158 [Kazachstania barnettii]CAB4256415.1 similar to Saccharomyces cerevisiae YHL017W Putative protein of unknown function [Kazachstania barnettii]